MICLSKGNPFNFSNMLLEGIAKSIKESRSYLLCPRFIQLFVENQISKVRTHRATYGSPKLVPKMFTFLLKMEKDFQAHINLLHLIWCKLCKTFRVKNQELPLIPITHPILLRLSLNLQYSTLVAKPQRTLSYLRLVLGCLYQMRLS